MLPELPPWSCGHHHPTRRQAIECLREAGRGEVLARALWTRLPDGEPRQRVLMEQWYDLIEPDRDCRLEQGEAQAREQMQRLAR